MGTVQQIPFSDPPESRELVLAQLEKILASAVFAKSDRLSHFLRFVVENGLRPGAEPLKETLIGIGVYGRPTDYDPKLEPIVRTEARRLRLKLTEYYNGPGAADRVVISVPTGGYTPQFEIRPGAVSKIVTLSASQILPKRSRISHLALSGIVASALVLLGISLAAAWLWRGGIQTSTVTREVAVTRLPGSAFQPAVSRDGKYVAFVWNGPDGNCCIYLKSLESGELHQLTHGRGHDLFPAWSPDGRSVAFVRMYPDGQKQVFLTSVAVAGALNASAEHERLLVTARAVQPMWIDDPSLLYLSPGPAWSPGGSFLAISDSPKEGESDSLYFVDVANSQKRRATTPRAGEVGDYFPTSSPDGRKLAFVRVSSQRFSSDIYVEDIGSGGLKRITFDSRGISGLTWISSSALVFSASKGGTSVLWTVSSGGGKPQLLYGAGHEVFYPSVASGGRARVYSERFRNTNVWRVPVRPMNEHRQSPVKLIESSTENDSAQYSPDGAKIAFVSDRSGVSEIWLCNADGSGAVSLFSGKGWPVGTPRWSPDGRSLAFDMVEDGRSVIGLLDVKNGAAHVFAAGPADNMMPSWSRDNRFIYYVSPTGTDQVEIWKKAVDGSGSMQVTHHGAGEAFESPDGGTLYYLKPRMGVWTVPPFGGEESAVSGLERVDSSRHFSLASSGMYFLSNESPPWVLKYRPFSGGPISDVAVIERTPEFATPSLSVSPDEKWLIYSQLDQSSEDLMLLEFAR
jgi:Tol biopolymer transport system component